MDTGFRSPVGMSGGSWYVFDVSTLKARISALRAALPEGTALCYAVKANPFLIHALEPWVERLEICSPGEWDICERLRIDARKAVVSGLYKEEDFIRRRVLDPGFTGILTVESMRQMEAAARAAAEASRTIPVLLRLTNGSQFGMNEDEIEAILRRRAEMEKLEFRGIQLFTGTQKTSLKKLRREIDTVDALMERMREVTGWQAAEFEFGPGLPAAYFREEPLDEPALLQGLSDALRSLRSRVHVTLELGRGIAAGCGRYYTRVVDLKCNRGQNYAIVDGGMHQLTYFGQYMAMKQPYFSVVGKEDWPAEETWNVCGALCSMNDILLKAAPMPKLEVGDVLCFERTGAYCMTEGMSLFLSRDLPAIYLREEDGTLRRVREAVETAALNTPKTGEGN